MFRIPPPHRRDQRAHCVTVMEHCISAQGLRQGRALTTARPFAGSLRGRKPGDQVYLGGQSGLRGCWGRAGVGPRGRSGEAGVAAEMLRGTRARRGSVQARLLRGRVTLGSILRFQLLLPFPLVLLFSFHSLSFFLRCPLSGTFLTFFSHFLFPSSPIYTLIDFFFSLTFLLSFLVFC